MKQTKTKRVVICGAGPVGVVAALACVQKGFDVVLLEAQAAVDESPRAATTHPATLEMLARVGLIDEFISQGLVARYVQFWDRPTTSKIVEFDHDVLREETDFPFVVQTEQHKLARMGIARLLQGGNATVKFQTSVTGVTQDANQATVGLLESREPREIQADYVIAADGGRSTLRKCLSIEFEGYTFPERFLVVTVLDDFEAMLHCCYRNYFSDPREWANLFKIAGDDGKGRWRVVFPTRADETDEQALEDGAVQERVQRLLPNASPYRVVHKNLYKVHQRVAATFRSGRVFLAGDSAHVNNSIGGLGLNGGIHDAMELAETLRQAGTDERILDRYERRRRSLNIEFIQQTTIANKKRLEANDAASRQAHADELRAIAADPARHKQFLMRSSLIESVRQSQLIA